MLLLTIRTDKPDAELGLYVDDNQLTYSTWEAHRKLAESIHTKIKAMLKAEHKSWRDIEGIVIYKGPGSFTGLRIGISVANALADSIKIPIVASDTKNWIDLGITRIFNGESDKFALPEYGAPPKTTKPKK